jgi:hypothetical protein
MSKPQAEKVIKDVSENPLLVDLEVPELTRLYARYRAKEAMFEKLAKKWEAKKKSVGVNLQVAANAVGADAVTFASQRFIWQASVVKGEPSKKLNSDKLRENLMKLHKLDAKTVQSLFDASSDDVPAKASYVIVSKRKNT